MSPPSPRPKKRSIYKYAAGILILNALICLGSLDDLQKVIRDVIRSREMVGAIEGISTAVKDAEVKQRTFLVTGADPDLWAYREATKDIDKRLETLAEEAKTSEVQNVRAESLRPYVANKKEELERVVTLRKAGGIGPVGSEIGTGQARRNSGEFQNLIDGLRRGEEDRLNRGVERARRAIGRSLVTFVFTSGLALLFLGLIAFFSRRELAERERAGEAIREREQWLSATLASISDAVIATDERGRVRLINPVAQALTGWDAPGAKGQALEKVFPVISEESREPLETPVHKVLSEGISVGISNHTLLIARDGTERPIEHCGAPIRGSDGAITGVVLCFRDVSARRWAERELTRSKDSADAANRAKDQFLAVLSHELRTPLTPVLVAVTAMLEGESSAELRPDLEMIRRNIELESRLIDDLLDLSRIARGRLRLQMEVVDVHETIRRAVEMCQAELRQAGLDVRHDLAAPRHHAHADEMRLMQVFWNLTTNAAKFTPSGGTLEVRTRNDDRGEGDLLIIEFRDTGIGFDSDLLPRIFDPFEQGDRVSRTRHGGLGLGLAISKNVVESHGGCLTAKSPGPGRGSTFRVELPIVPTPARIPSTPLPPLLPPKRRGLSILLVEDNKDTLRYLSLILDQHGHRVFTAEGVGAAREAVANEAIDLLISDVELPDGSGLDLMRDLAAERSIQGIAISGFGAQEDLQMSEQAGFQAHLVKPIDVRTLEEAIRTVCARSEFSRP